MKIDAFAQTGTGYSQLVELIASGCLPVLPDSVVEHRCRQEHYQSSESF